MLDREALARPPGSIGHDLHYFPQVDSTFDYFHTDGAVWGHGSAVLTDYQAAGRGRRGRRWSAPAGSSVLLTVALRWPERVPPVYGVMLASVAVCEAIGSISRMQAGIKWPNDVLLRGRKACGILAEHVATSGGSFALLGIGVNVNVEQGDLPSATETTSLAIELGQRISREAIVAALFEQLDLWYCFLTEQPGRLFSAWTARMTMIGTKIVVTESSRTWEGTAVDIRPDGALVVLTPDGDEHALYAADVSVRSPEPNSAPS